MLSNMCMSAALMFYIRNGICDRNDLGERFMQERTNERNAKNGNRASPKECEAQSR